jgi:Na+/proline symporter
MLTPENFITPLCLSSVILFGAWALFKYVQFTKTKQGMEMDTEFFLTARGTQPWPRIAWGLFATSVGSGVIFGPASYVLSGGGVVGMVCYSFFAGFPLIVVAYMGKRIKSRFPKPMSIASFAEYRFGKAMQIYVTANVLFNLGIALAVEYTAIGGLFKTYLNTPEWVPILTVGLVTMAYTIAGGLFISILTDQVQSIFIITMISVVGVYLSVNFRHSQLGELPPQLGTEAPMGWSSFATLGIALTTSTIFSDAVWQRVWAAKDETSLIQGSYVGMVLTVIVTFFFSSCGLIAGWAGLVDFSDQDAVNTGFFAILKPTPEAQVPIAILAVVCMLAATLNESAVDSFQNAILDTILSVFVSLGFKISLNTARVVVVLLNVPLMVVGVQGFPIINLYLMTNLLTSASALPLCIGLFPYFDTYVSGTSF